MAISLEIDAAWVFKGQFIVREENETLAVFRKSIPNALIGMAERDRAIDIESMLKGSSQAS